MDFSKLNLNDNQDIARIIIKEASTKEFKDKNEFQKFRNKVIKKHKWTIFHNLYFIKAYNDLLKEGSIKPNTVLLDMIQKRSVRTMSGVAPVTVLTKQYPCPGQCVYCPTDIRMPKSYIPSQPAAQRGFRQRFDPYTQVYVRLKALEMTGHQVSKIELRVLGGTWSAYPKKYQTWFIKRCLQSMNEFSDNIKKDNQTLKKNTIRSVYGVDEVNTIVIERTGAKKWEEIVKENEVSDTRCIGINIETRPDYITEAEVKRLRYLGVTKVELGVQTVYDDIQKLTKRGHTLDDVKRATQLLKDSGFKIGYHIMPNLPGSTPKKDKEMIKILFKEPLYKPDYLKIYPCMVLPNTVLATMMKRGEYRSYEDKVLEEILYDNLKQLPEWVRLDRLARDIPADKIVSGLHTSNIRQVLEKRLKDEGISCREIRAREIKKAKVELQNIEYIERIYEASKGKEYFISYEDTKKDKIIGLLRLRLPYKPFIFELRDTAIIREVHVYGKQVAVGKKSKDKKQHIGWGSRLMKRAEEICKKNGLSKLAVISGIGTRKYYEKLGYNLVGTYMIKDLQTP